MKKRKHPKFTRPNYGRSSRSRIKDNWRRQRGIDNKKRAKIAYMGCSPSIGYGQPAEIKYTHPLGLKEVLVQSPKEIAGLANVLIRIAKGVGRKKREEIYALAQKAGLKILNKKKEVVKEKKVDKKGAAKPATPAAAPAKQETKPAATALTTAATAAGTKPVEEHKKSDPSVHIPMASAPQSGRESKKSVNKQGKQGVM